MDRLEAMIHLEVYGSVGQCSGCGHTVPSIYCSVEENGCPLLTRLQASEVEDDVKAKAEEIRTSRRAEGKDTS